MFFRCYLLLSLITLVCCPAGSHAQQLQVAPVLKIVSPTMATVSVQLDQKARVYLHLANNANMNNARLFQPVHSKDGGRTLHFELDGLLPDKTYHTQVTLNGKAVKTLSFQTISYDAHYALLKSSSPPEEDDELAAAEADEQAAEAMLAEDTDTLATAEEPEETPAEQAAIAEAEAATEQAVNPMPEEMDSLIAEVAVDENIPEVTPEKTQAEKAEATATDTRTESTVPVLQKPQRADIKPNESDSMVEDLPPFNPPINAKEYGLVVQPTLGYTFIKIYMSKREKLSPQSQVVIFDSRGVDLKRQPQVIRQNGIQGIELAGFKKGRYFVRLEALDGNAIWGEFTLR